MRSTWRQGVRAQAGIVVFEDGPLLNAHIQRGRSERGPRVLVRPPVRREVGMPPGRGVLEQFRGANSVGLPIGKGLPVRPGRLFPGKGEDFVPECRTHSANLLARPVGLLRVGRDPPLPQAGHHGRMPRAAGKREEPVAKGWRLVRTSGHIPGSSRKSRWTPAERGGLSRGPRRRGDLHLSLF